MSALSEWKFRGGLAPQDAGKPGGAGKQGAQPAWIFYSGFSRHKRRELLRLFCLQIRHEPDPCSPELYSDGQKQSLVQDSSVGADASPHVEDVEKEEPALAQAEQEEELLVIVQPRGSVTKDVFNFTSPLPLVLHVPASCDADTIEVHVDGFLKTPYLSAWRTRAAGEVARGVEGEGVSGNGQWLECSMGKGVEFEGSPDGVMLEGFHSIEVSVMCSGGVGGGGRATKHSRHWWRRGASRCSTCGSRLM